MGPRESKLETVTETVSGPIGPAGPMGPAGPVGPVGPVGPAGATGLPGLDGRNGLLDVYKKAAPPFPIGQSCDQVCKIDASTSMCLIGYDNLKEKPVNCNEPSSGDNDWSCYCLDPKRPLPLKESFTTLYNGRPDRTSS